MRATLLISALFALFALGCATPQSGPTVTRRGEPPSREEAEKAVLDHLSRLLKDPDSVKQFQITYGPVPIQWYRGLLQGGGNEQAWLVCFEYNAKNSYGA